MRRVTDGVDCGTVTAPATTVVFYSPWTNGGCLGPCLALTKKVCIFETANLKRREVIVTIPNNDVRLGTESEHAVQCD